MHRTDFPEGNAVSKPDRSVLFTIPAIVLIGLTVALAGGRGGAAAFGIPVFWMATGLAFAIQWVAFTPAYLLQSERFFDLTGGFTYLSVAAMAVLLIPIVDGRSLLLLALVSIWAVRLGLFLFRRIHRAGKDGRFDEIKTSFLRFLSAWTLQGLWVALTLAAALAAITTTVRESLGLYALIGALIWAAGFAIEVISDRQKSHFRADPGNAGRFIRTGLWARSRHPNYFGEIILWVGVAVIAFPVLHGWQYVTLISPVFVALLLTRGSGIPILERRADEKWSGQPDYEKYRAQTPILVPRLTRAG